MISAKDTILDEAFVLAGTKNPFVDLRLHSFWKKVKKEAIYELKTDALFICVLIVAEGRTTSK